MSGIPPKQRFHALGSPLIQDFLKLKFVPQGLFALSRKTGMKNERPHAMQVSRQLASRTVGGISRGSGSSNTSEHVSENALLVPPFFW
jgi:hypothetical protein